MKQESKLFKWKHFEGIIIMWLVRWYGRYALSYADLKEMAAESGLKIERSTICRWVHEYGAMLAKFIKPFLKSTEGSWRLDETYVKIKGVWHYLYRAIDKSGQTLDWMLSRKRNTKTAKRFFKKVLSNKHVKNPYVVNVDKNPAFVPAHAELQKSGDFKQNTKLRQVKYLNNGIENDHKSTKFKSRYRQWYQNFDTAKNTIDAVETMRMIQKGQLRYASKDVCAQNKLINKIFGLAA